MNIVFIALVVVALALAGLAWFLLKGRKPDQDEPEALVAPAEEPVSEAAPLVIAPPVEAAPAPAPAPVPAPAPAVAKPPVVAAPVAPPPPSAPPPAESITVIMARPRPQLPVVERVLVLENVDVSEWDAARPLVLSAVQSAAVATAMTAATRARPGESTVHAVRFDAGSAIRIARGDVDAIRAIAAARATSTQSKARWLDSVAATALAATALAALAGERWLDALGDEMRDLKASVAALPPKLAGQGEGRLKALVQDLSRFAREARDNYVSVIGKFAFRERVGEGCDRAASAWQELIAGVDALRQQLEAVAKSPRFGEVQVERAIALWRDLHEQERLQEIAARVLAGMHTLRLSLGDAAPGRGVDPLASAAAALQSGIDQDRDLAVLVASGEKGAKGDPYVGKAEFEANRATLRKLLERPTGEAMALAMSRLHAAAATEPLDAGAGAPSRLLVQAAQGESAASLRWSSAPQSR